MTEEDIEEDPEKAMDGKHVCVCNANDEDDSDDNGDDDVNKAVRRKESL